MIGLCADFLGDQTPPARLAYCFPRSWPFRIDKLAFASVKMSLKDLSFRFFIKCDLDNDVLLLHIIFEPGWSAPVIVEPFTTNAPVPGDPVLVALTGESDPATGRDLAFRVWPDEEPNEDGAVRLSLGGNPSRPD